VWDAESGALIGAPLPCGGKTHLLAEKSGAPEVLVQTAQEQPWSLDVEHGTRQGTLVVSGDLRAASWLEGRPLVLTSTRAGFVLSAGDNGEVLLTPMHDAHGNDAVFSTDGLRLLTRAVQGNSRVWDLDATRALTPFLWEGADPAFCEMDSTGQHVLLASRESAIRLWRIEDLWGAIAEGPAPPESRRLDWLHDQLAAWQQPPPAFHRDSVAGSPVLDSQKPSPRVLHVLDPSTGRDLFPPLRHEARVIDAVFSPDGRVLASYAENQCAYLWDAHTGEPIGPLLRHSREIDSIAFSPDGALLLTTARFVLQVWEVATGTLAAPPMPQPYPIRRAWWKADGTAIFTVDLKEVQREWKIAPGHRSVEDLQILGRLYSSHRVTTGAALHPLGLEDLRSAWEAAEKIQHP
jgi:WD40 repeat protein